jgi:hypothetical protein
MEYFSPIKRAPGKNGRGAATAEMNILLSAAQTPAQLFVRAPFSD